MRHTGARAVRQHIAGASPGWHLQQARDALRIVDPDDDRLQEVGLHIDSLTDLAVRIMMARATQSEGSPANRRHTIQPQGLAEQQQGSAQVHRVSHDAVDAGIDDPMTSFLLMFYHRRREGILPERERNDPPAGDISRRAINRTCQPAGTAGRRRWARS
jgi:hypothetical protein